MACSNRINRFRSDLDTVRVLAQKAADLLYCNQIIYKVYCDGITIYKFSDNWKGTAEETVTPGSTVQLSRNDTNQDILPDIENGEYSITKSSKRKNKRTRTGFDLE